MSKKSILLASDLEYTSEQALLWAVDQALRFDTDIYVLFCYRLIQPADAPGNVQVHDLRKTIENDAIAKIENVKSKMMSLSPVSCHFMVEVGFYVNRIEEFVRKMPVSSVVMPSNLVIQLAKQEERSFRDFISNNTVPLVIIPSRAA